MTSSKPTKVGSFHSQKKEKKMAKEILYGTECKHWKDCEFRNGLDCDSEMCEEFEIDE